MSECVQTEDKSFIRDTQSKALLNTDRAALERHRALRRKLSEQQAFKREVQSLRKEVAELKALVLSLTMRF